MNFKEILKDPEHRHDIHERLMLTRIEILVTKWLEVNPGCDLIETELRDFLMDYYGLSNNEARYFIDMHAERYGS